MFIRKGFGNAEELAWIEKIYSVEIDDELVQDHCAGLLEMLDADRELLTGSERKLRQDWYTCLTEYIAFRQAQPELLQKQRFCAWLKQQPQREHPEKGYAEATVLETATKLESGLGALGVAGYEGINCFTITDSDSFRTLHKACYAAAADADKAQGHRDFRNGLDFYLRFLNETTFSYNRHAATEKIRFVIAHYKANFATVHKQEIYKWKAIHHYQQHWDIEAPNFADMLANAFRKASNLLSSGNYFPLRMIKEFAQAEPEAVRTLFRTLYDESLPLEERFQAFRQGCASRIQRLKEQDPNREKTLHHYQDPRAMMVYLTFRYPEKYYLFKSTMYADFRERVGFAEQSGGKSVVQKIEDYFRLCELVLSVVRKDAELLELHTKRLDDTCYPDEALHLLTMDVIYYGSNYMSADLFNPPAQDQYWPKSQDYDPGITKEMWLSILQDKTITTEKVQKLLDMFMQLGGESSFNHLVEEHGNQFFYKGTLQEFSTRVISKFGCKPCPAAYKDYAKFIIPFVGRNIMEGTAKSTSWKLRSELKEALDSLDGFWPTLTQYDPKLTKEDWKRYIQEVELPHHPSCMQMLKALMDLGGQASCKRLSELYGGKPSRYVGCSVSIGKRAKKYFDLPPCMDEGQERYFPIPFVGKWVHEGESKFYIYRIRPELFAALKELDLSGVSLYAAEQEETMATATDIGLNTILYGPPGTGKTYHTVIYAVAIIENKKLAQVQAEDYDEVLKRYREYRFQGRIEFTTFHQSYGYEEFIEGIRPVITDDGDQTESGDLQYRVQPGVFKKFCEKAELPTPASTGIGDLGIRENATVWKVSLWSTGENEVRKECLLNGHIRIGWDQYGKDITDETDFSADGGRVVLNAFINKMQIGDIVFSCYSASTIDAIGVVTGEYEWNEKYEYFRRVRKVRWIVKDIRENILSLNGGTSMTLASVYRLSGITIPDVYKLIEKYQPTKLAANSRKENHVFIIDEINRGNISKIFGELITLIEESKRMGGKEATKTLLPYSITPFGIPENVYLIGTMNTADRSIAAIDTALRRRFDFREMLPEPEVLQDLNVAGISISKMLTQMNRRITVLYDREHTIGHAYFMPLKEDCSLKTLAEIFRNKVIPLLQEYFFEDYEKIRLVLGDNQKKDEKDRFIKKVSVKTAELFGKMDFDLDIEATYEINQDAFMNPEAYRNI